MSEAIEAKHEVVESGAEEAAEEKKACRNCGKAITEEVCQSDQSLCKDCCKAADDTICEFC